MRAVWLKRPVLLLGVIGLLLCTGIYLKRGYEQRTDEELDTPRRSLYDLEESISNLHNVVKVFEQKQDAMQKLLEENRGKRREAEEVKEQPQQKEQPEAKIQDQKEPPIEKKSNKLFPDSALFKKWGENLSEDDQKEAEALFVKYGYNVFLSDRLPLDRALPDTRDPRCMKKSYPKDLPSLGVVLIYLNEALSILKRALRSIIDRTPKNLLKEIIMVDDNSSNGWFVTNESEGANKHVIHKSSHNIYRLHRLL